MRRNVLQQCRKNRFSKTALFTGARLDALNQALVDKPDHSSHWSSRRISRETGLSSANVMRIWHVFGIKPHLEKTPKLSNAPLFVAKVNDIVWRYLNPHEQILVLCFDEKSLIQALGHTQSGIRLPRRPGCRGCRGLSPPSHPFGHTANRVTLTRNAPRLAQAKKNADPGLRFFVAAFALLLDEGTLDQVVTRLAHAWGDFQAEAVEHFAGLVEHARAAADHRAVVFRVDRW
jgi:hypothetical protein